MTWELGSKPGVVDARDRYGRPMPVSLRSDPLDFTVPDLDFQPLDDDARGWWLPIALIGIGYIAGTIVTALLVWRWWR